MAETTIENPELPKKPFSLRTWYLGNPVLVKELRARMRGSRAFTLLTVYLGVLALLVVLVYLVFLASSNSLVGSVNDRRALGKAIFGVVFGMELMAVCFIAPGLTAGSISAERERLTLDLLRTTLLPARALVLGKFFAAVSFLLLLLFSALPLQSLAFLFGGVAAEEVLVGTVLLVVTAVTFCAVGMLCSSFLARTLTSTVLAYGFAILLVFGLPFLFFIVFGLLGTAFSGVSGQLSVRAETLLFLVAWLLVSLNPLSTAVSTEIILTEQQNVLYFIFPLPNGASLSLISPWIVYCLAYLLLSLGMLWLSVRLVKRVEK